VVGFINPVSEPYCGTCNRMRLTADGRFHLCLLRDDELDVRAALRRGADEDEIAAILLRAVGAKPTGHELHAGVSTLERSMHHLGG
jgi:cyclic pyranopterin phosphate synthase